jgi:signal transduction histidine kinase
MNLAIVCTIVIAHGGVMEVESNPRGGASLHVIRLVDSAGPR